MTKAQLKQYKYLEKAIESGKKKMERLKNKPPKIEYGKVYGSSSNWPFCERGFTVSGPGETDGKKWEQDMRRLYLITKNNTEKYAKLKRDIEYFIETIEDPRDKFVIETYIIQGKTQEEVSRVAKIDRSYVSIILDKYIQK